jgi:hypothetical protein
LILTQILHWQNLCVSSDEKLVFNQFLSGLTPTSYASSALRANFTAAVKFEVKESGSEPCFSGSGVFCLIRRIKTKKNPDD